MTATALTRRSLASIVVVGVLAGASPASAADGITSTAAVSHPGYWTPQRMLQAFRDASPRRAAVAVSAGGASPAPTQLPGMRALGTIFSLKPNGQTYACSGTLVTSRNRSLVWTAGHCIHDGRRGAFHTNVAFVPGYQPKATGNPAPYGAWQAAWLGVPKAWELHGAAESHRRYRPEVDAGVLVLVRDAQRRTLTDVLGVSQRIRFEHDVRHKVRLIGYPGDAPYLGEHLMQCGPRHVHHLRASPLHRMRCSLGKGMSGGPALAGMNRRGVGTVVGALTSRDKRRSYFSANPRLFRGLYRKFTSQRV